MADVRWNFDYWTDAVETKEGWVNSFGDKSDGLPPPPSRPLSSNQRSHEKHEHSTAVVWLGRAAALSDLTGVVIHHMPTAKAPWTRSSSAWESSHPLAPLAGWYLPFPLPPFPMG